MIDLQAAREAAERSRTGGNYFIAGPAAFLMSSVPHVEHDDLRKCRDALLAILDDPTVLLPVPKWEEKADPTGHPFWLLATIAGTFYSGQQQTDRRWWSQCFGRVEFHPSLSAAQSACESDFRERMRGAFQETKTAPGA